VEKKSSAQKRTPHAFRAPDQFALDKRRSYTFFQLRCLDHSPGSASDEFFVEHRLLFWIPFVLDPKGKLSIGHASRLFTDLSSCAPSELRSLAESGQSHRL
jgi:hypothetical protein